MDKRKLAERRSLARASMVRWLRMVGDCGNVVYGSDDGSFTMEHEGTIHSLAVNPKTGALEYSMKVVE